jgi:hypothetical protein
MEADKPLNQKGAQREVKLTLDADAADLLLDLAGGPRKQGEFVSKLIRAAASGQVPNLDVLDRILSLERELSTIGQELAQVKAEIVRPA